MKKATFFVGPPCSGKSTFTNELNIENLVLSMDKIRQLYYSPTLYSHDGDYEWSINNDHNDSVLRRFSNILNHKIRFGETIFVETTLLRDFDLIKQLTEEGYETNIISFSGLAPEFLMERNKNRHPLNIIPSHIIEKINNQTEKQILDLERMHRNGKINNFIQVHDNPFGMNIKKLDELRQLIRNIISPEYVDLNEKGIDRVLFIGDIQGCASVFEKAMLDNEYYRKGTLTVLTGDLLDRGRENGLVINLLLSKFERDLKKKRILILQGNHENHFVNYANDREVQSDQFNRFTLPDLLSSNVSKKDLKQISKGIIPFFRYKLDGHLVNVTHTGLESLPKGFNGLYDSIGLMDSNTLSRGLGEWSDPVDRKWQEYIEKINQPNLFQVHGHRNGEEISPTHYRNSINLESGVEFGGKLSVVEHTRGEWIDKSIANDFKHSYYIQPKDEAVQNRTARSLDKFKK